MDSSPTPLPPSDNAKNIDLIGAYSSLQPYLIGVCTLAIVIILGWGALTVAADAMHKQVQKEYLNITDDASRAAFVKKHGKQPLGGLVLLGQAHEYYNKGNYVAAQAAYSQAATTGLKTQPILRDQARLGEAFAIYGQSEAKGITALRTIVQDTTMMEATRAHAASELAGYYAQKGEWEAAKDYVKVVETLKDARPWQRQVDVLKQIYPQLGA